MTAQQLRIFVACEVTQVWFQQPNRGSQPSETTNFRDQIPSSRFYVHQACTQCIKIYAGKPFIQIKNLKDKLIYMHVYFYMYAHVHMYIHTHTYTQIGSISVTAWTDDDWSSTKLLFLSKN